jgi:hypothetical protein
MVVVPEEDEDEGVEEEVLVEHLLEGVILPSHRQVLQLSIWCLQDPFPWRNTLNTAYIPIVLNTVYCMYSYNIGTQ